MIGKLLPIIVAVVAIYAAVNFWPQEQKVKPHANPVGESHIDLKEANRINKAMKAIQEIGGFPKYPNNCSKIAIGYNANNDVLMYNHDIFLMTGKSQPPAQPKDHEVIHNLDELYQTLAYFFSQGAAAERFVDPTFYEQFAKDVLNFPRRYVFAGGNAAIMNNAFLRDIPCLKTLLGGFVGKELSKMVRAHKIVPEQSGDKEEFHIIIEYAANETWGNLRAPRANRLILQSDKINSQLKAMDAFHEETIKFAPRLAILAGVHLMEHESEEFKKTAFAKMNDFLTKLPKSTLVHFELASTASKEFPLRMFQEVITRCDSLGLNEQELGALYRSLGGSEYTDFNTNINPRTAIEAMKFIFQNSKQEGRKLNRIHFHTLHFQIIGQRNSVKEWGHKDDQMVGVTTAVMVVVREACNAFAFTPDQLDVRAPELIAPAKNNNETKFWEVPASMPIASIKEEGFRFAYSASLICKKPSKTVGLGDIISATALLYQLRL